MVAIISLLEQELVQRVNAWAYRRKYRIIVSSRFHQRDQTTHVKIINNHTIQTAATANKMAVKVGKLAMNTCENYLCQFFLVKINKLLKKSKIN